MSDAAAAKGKAKAKDKGGEKEKKKVTKKAVTDDGSGNKSKAVSVLDEAAMENAYNICHNVQDLLYFRGFFWEGSNKGKERKTRQERQEREGITS